MKLLNNYTDDYYQKKKKYWITDSLSSHKYDLDEYVCSRAGAESASEASNLFFAILCNVKFFRESGISVINNNSHILLQ